jgi:hypothetical protein
MSFIRSASILAVLAAGLGFSTPAGAADAPAPLFTAAPGATFLLDQDTPDYSMSVWQAQDLKGVNAIRAKMTVRRLASGAKMNPTFGIMFENGADTAIFQVFTRPGKTLMIPVVSEEKDHTEKAGLAGGVFLSSFEGGDHAETVDLAIDWTDAGVITITLRDKASAAINDFERESVTLRGGPPTSLKFIGGNGEVEYNPVQLGHTGS